MSWWADLQEVEAGDSGPAVALPVLASGPAPERRADSVFNQLTGLGGGRDKGQAARPNPYVLPLADEELLALYAYNGMARKIVDLLPSRATRKGWSVPDVVQEDRRLKTWGRINEAAAMAGLYGGSAVLLVTEDDVPPSFRARPELWLQEPLDLERVGRLHAIQVLDAFDAGPQRYSEDVRDTSFRSPSLWSIAVPGFRATVHGSRVLHLRGSRRPPSDRLTSRFSGRNRMPDNSVLQVIWDEISRLTQTMQGGAILAQEIREAVLKIGNLPSKQVGDEAEALQTRLALMARSRSVVGMTFIGPNDEFESRANPPTGFAELSGEAKAMLSAVTGIPQVILFGDTPSGLNTDGDSAYRGFRELISDYQEVQLRDPLEQLYRVVYAAQDGPTRGRPPEEWALTFAPLDEPSSREQAELRKLVAETDAIYLDRGVFAPSDVAVSRFGADGWQIDLEEVQVPDLADEAALEALRAQMLAGASEEEQDQEPADEDEAQEPAEEERGDAVSGCCVLVRAPDRGLLELRSGIETAIGQRLVVEGDPHVTVLYLGELGEPGRTVPEVVAAVGEAARDAEVGVLERGAVRTFPPGAKGTPVVVEFGDGWMLEALNASLLRGLAHLVTARQHRRFRPHLTLGYAPTPLTPEATAALLEREAAGIRVPIAALEVRLGDELVASVPVGA